MINNPRENPDGEPEESNLSELEENEQRQMQQGESGKRLPGNETVQGNGDR